MYTHTCKLCGGEYQSTMPHGNVCNKCKNRPCEICGQPFLHDWPYDQRTCSEECRHKLRIDPANVARKEAKKKQNLLNKYGVDNVSKLPEIKEKISASHKSDEFKEKIKATSLTKYGVADYRSSPEHKAKIKEGFIRKFGVDNVSKVDAIRQKISEKLKDPEVRAHYIQTCMEHYGVPHPGSVPEVRAKSEATCMEKYGVPYYIMTPEYRSGQATNQISSLNRAFATQLKELYDIDSEFEFKVDRKLYDIHILNSTVLIEIDPSYTHSDLPNHWCEGLSPDYHLAKTQVAEKHGYRCIHVFDWDNLDKVAAMLQPKTKLYARKCRLSRIDNKVSAEFIDEYHLQGSARGTIAAYGLYFDDMLVEVMTFGKPRYNKNYEWELLRLCSQPQFSVLGGASRLFSQFVRDFFPTSIISYCDKAKFSGDVYHSIGMELHHESDPAKVWSKDDQRITDNLLRQRGFDQLFGTNYGKGTSNEELMIQDGWRSVYDCGQKVFEWKAST